MRDAVSESSRLVIACTALRSRSAGCGGDPEAGDRSLDGARHGAAGQSAGRGGRVSPRARRLRRRRAEVSRGVDAAAGRLRPPLRARLGAEPARSSRGSRSRSSGGSSRTAGPGRPEVDSARRWLAEAESSRRRRPRRRPSSDSRRRLPSALSRDHGDGQRDSSRGRASPRTRRSPSASSSRGREGQRRRSCGPS